MTIASSNSAPPRLKFEVLATIRHIAQKDGWYFEIIQDSGHEFRAVTYRKESAAIVDDDVFATFGEAAGWLEEQAERIAGTGAVLAINPGKAARP
jgi:hypothetical protein